MRVVLMGPQGSGKGTQGSNLSQGWGVPHVATGDMLRQVMRAEDSPRAREIQGINAGNHVSDALIGELLYARLLESDAKNGFILDGYPRNLVQAEILEGYLQSMGLALEGVIALEVPYEILLKRLLLRAEREGRVDDSQRDAIERRLSLYQEWTLPVLSFYETRGLLVRLEATASPEAVTREIILALSKK
jgi:adenylate kinase